MIGCVFLDNVQISLELDVLLLFITVNWTSLVVGTGFPSNNLWIKVQGEHQNNTIILSPSLVVLHKKIFKSFFDSRDYLSCGDLEGPEKPEN